MDWFLFVSGGLLKRYANPVFNLIVKWPRGNKVRGQVIGISEYEMDRAIRKLSNADTGFARRIRCLEPTPEDVEAIVLEASWGYVQLELEVYDKNLRTNKQPLKDDLLTEKEIVEVEEPTNVEIICAVGHASAYPVSVHTDSDAQISHRYFYTVNHHGSADSLFHG